MTYAVSLQQPQSHLCIKEHYTDACTPWIYTSGRAVNLPASNL